MAGSVKLLALCGIDCLECPAYLATQNNDDQLREKTAAQWSAMFKAQIRPQDINCDGCLGPGPRRFAHCHQCQIRACALERGLANCAACPEYACDKLQWLLDAVPAAKANLDEARSAT